MFSSVDPSGGINIGGSVSTGGTSGTTISVGVGSGAASSATTAATVPQTAQALSLTNPAVLIVLIALVIIVFRQ